MNILIIATHEDADAKTMLMVRTPERAERTINLLKQCGYIRIETESTEMVDGMSDELRALDNRVNG